MNGAEHVLCDEVHQVYSDGEHGFIHVYVTSSLPARSLTPDLALAVTDVVRDRCFREPAEVPS